jgi:hypothetical protein
MSRVRLSYANVMSTIAVFLGLGGSAVAVANAINGHSLVNRSVPGVKLVRNGVTGAEVKESTLGVVPSATHAASAGTATSAQKAATATSATTADTAANATNAGTANTAVTAATATNSLELGGTIPAPAWHSLPLISGCTSNTSNGESLPEYFKDAFGVVHLQGKMSCPSSNAFTLPAGYRPAHAQMVMVAANDTGHDYELVISAAGVGSIFTTANTIGTPILDGVTFRTS